MINQFIWPEIFLFAWPILSMYFGVMILKPQIHDYNVTVATCLLPTWLLIINAFSLLIYNFSILPLLFVLSIFIVVLALHDYIRQVKEYFIADFLVVALRVLFISWTFFLVGIMVTRVVSYFFV